MRTHRIEKLALLSLVLSIVENNHANVSIIDGVANKSLYKFCYKRHIATAFNGIASPQKNSCARTIKSALPPQSPAARLFHIFHPTPPKKRADSAIDAKSALK